MNKRIRKKRAKASWKRTKVNMTLDELRGYLQYIFIERYEKEIQNN